METSKNFNELGLAPFLLETLKEIGYETASPIQSVAIPPLLEGRDVLGQAQTGTGKTAAFALPVLQALDISNMNPQALILAPTRELAIQVSEAFQTYAKKLKGFHVLPVYGGQGMQHQLKQLKRGVHVIVGTPGRVMDHLRRKTLLLNNIKTIVLDEADEMLRMGFIDDVEWILEQLPAERRVALFSATMPAEIKRVAQRHLNNPVEVKIKSPTATVSAIKQYYVPVNFRYKIDALTRILDHEETDGIIIFVRTRNNTIEVADKLIARGFETEALNGEITQAKREKTIEKLKNGEIDIIVATDVAARGLDVKRITHVINYDISQDVESYIHRIGRTGRAGKLGVAILFASGREMRMLKDIERVTGQRMELMNLPSAETITNKRVDQFHKMISETIETQDLEFFSEMISEIVHKEEVSIEQLAAALAYLAQKDKPLKTEKLSEIPLERESNRGGHRDSHRDGDFNRPKKGRDMPGRSQGRSGGGVAMDSFRIEVGSEHGLTAGEIVGAIANEAGITGDKIKGIRISKTYSTVDLPKDLPAATISHLKKVRVRQLPMQISKLSEKAHISRSSGSGKSKPFTIKKRKV